jgi:cellobiose dehydrogenase (acceptor)
MGFLRQSFVLGLASFATTASASWDTDSWDIIVVGAGPAGIIVADRMSEAGKKTLLIEGGGPSYYITGGRDRPAWLNGTKLSRVDVPGTSRESYHLESHSHRQQACTSQSLRIREN